jgi:2-keto-4-pentenoate hydratase/2-oxohepta-3-ene-1,7-dioic acid hydratase in catechol pathway
MKLYTVQLETQTRLTVEKAGALVDVTTAAGTHDLVRLIENFEALGPRVAEAVEKAVSVLDFDDVTVKAPLKPGKILCCGVNYHGHFTENPAAKMPQKPFFFAKFPSNVLGPGEPIPHPPGIVQLDWEVEFTLVFGKKAHALPEDASVMDAIFGYTILHDVSARDVQFVDNQITLGKNFEGFAPVGPCVVTKDELPDLSNVKLRTLLNGEAVQDGSTADWIYPLPHLITWLTSVLTMHPGDLMTTGTPAGVGYFHNPQRFMKSGDVVRLEIGGIGVLENPIS